MLKPKIVNLLVKKCQRPKEKICAKNLKSTRVCGKLVDQSIKTSHEGQELWMSYVKNLTFHQAVSKKQLHSLRTALTREVKKEITEGHQSRWKFYTALTYMKDDVRSLKVKTENKTKLLFHDAEKFFVCSTISRFQFRYQLVVNLSLSSYKAIQFLTWTFRFLLRGCWASSSSKKINPRVAIARFLQKPSTSTILFADKKHAVDQSQRRIFLISRNLQDRNLLRDKLRSKVVLWELTGNNALQLSTQ